jgi:hypothetical protein
MTTEFKRRIHPGGQPRAQVYAYWLVGPIGACTVPVMIGATAAALQGQTVWEYLVWGLPSALVVASIWTQFSLSRTVTEVQFRAGQCAVRSLHDVLVGRPPKWHPLYGLQESEAEIELSFGWSTEVIRRREWPQFAQLRDAARHAVQGRHTSSARPATPT